LRRTKRKIGYRGKADPHKINNRINADPVRLIHEGNSDIVSLDEARKMAYDSDLDLVEISPNAQPPVCKILDYKRFLFEQKKRAKEQKAKNIKMVIKEIRFGPNTDEHDVEFKRKHAEKFINEGNKVRAYVFFRGRSIVHKERGELLLLQFAESLAEISKLEQMPKMEGKKMIIMLAPKK